MSTLQVFDIPIGEDKRDLTPQGTYGFPLAVYLQELHKNVLGFINWHWHEGVQFCKVVCGEVLFHVNSQQYRIGEGDGLFINADCIHMARPDSGPDATYICLNVDPKLLYSFPCSTIDIKYIRPLLSNSALAAIPLDKNGEWQEGMLQSISHVLDLTLEKTATYEIDVQTQLFIMLGHLARNVNLCGGNLKVDSTGNTIKSIFNFVHQHYAEDISLEQVASAAHMSKSACCRFFKAASHMTLFQYIMDYRINKSLELLRLTDMKVSHIANAVGIGSVSYFIEKFRLRTGTTPKEYRKAIAAESAEGDRPEVA